MTFSATCPTCSGPAHLDRDLIRCDSCGRTALCRCLPVKAERVPVWIARQRQGRLPAKELVA